MFNILWSAGDYRKDDELEIIPFYYSIRDSKQSLKQFALEYFTSFIKCYLLYKKRDIEILSEEISLSKLVEKISDKYLIRFCETMINHIDDDNWQGMWFLASEAPAKKARLNNVKIVQIIDEFQYINEYIR